MGRPRTSRATERAGGAGPRRVAGVTLLELLIVLNNGTYQSISLSAWMAANPHLLLATNFKVPESTFANFPTRERFMPG